ncbi:MAG TPA: PxKF domain-containing protein, partial [Kineosporiaceae bacterium]|nr:PxKF domain-containing protein [Kineosporiaceae bacterium]
MSASPSGQRGLRRRAAARHAHQAHDRRPQGRRLRRRLLPALAAVALAVPGIAVVAPAVFASSVTSARFEGGAGTVTVGGVLYARNGAALTLTVTTSSDTTCVKVTGAENLGTQMSSTPKETWTFARTAGPGNGTLAFTVAASPSYDSSGCTGGSTSTQASYVEDNSGPNAVAALSPTANAAGWNNTDVTVSWTAVDPLSGPVAPQPFQTSTVTSEGIVPVTAPAQADRLGNIGSGGLTYVRLDKTPPKITAAQTVNPNGTTTITFTCADPDPSGAGASGIATCSASGAPNHGGSVTVGGGVTVTGTAADAAGNTTTITSTSPDTTPPTLSGAPTTEPNANGWYSGDVTIHWTAADPESGIPAPPADTTISGEGTALVSSARVTNGAGLTSTATSPPVKIDRTPPTTGLTGTSNTWSNGDVTLTLNPTDNLSGVASTSYAVDGGAIRTGTTVTLSSDGDHTVTFSSTDKAGNAEAPQTTHVRIDKTAPTIGHTFTPLTYHDGTWTNADVTVTFECTDQGGSGIATCTHPVTKTAEGEGQTAVGVATDNAGNSATDTAVVSIDKTAPTIHAEADRPPNAAGWYAAPVTVTFDASDALSGVASVTAPRVLAEGADQSVTGTAADAAGNSATDVVSGVDVDTTPPVLSGDADSGWHTGDVTVGWSCTDALSGVADRPGDTTVTGEGAALTATASCTDRAGNVTISTVDGIAIDRTPPTTTAEVPPLPASGWYGAGLEVTLHGSDNLSGVAATYYTIDDGPRQTYDGPFGFATDGSHTVRSWSVDKAGNVEAAGAPLRVNVDGTAPTTALVDPVSPAGGWFVSSGIPFAFDPSDATSGVAATYYAVDGGEAQIYGRPFTADLSTGGHTVTYWSVDVAGNTEPARTLTLEVDTVAPTISGSQNPPANAAGWNSTPVDVTFACDDVGSGVSGVAGCAGDTRLVNEGAGQTVHGDAVDVAGNRSGIDYGPVSIDMTKPTLKGVPATANAAGWYKDDVTVAWVGDDGLSGIDPSSKPADTVVTGEGTDLTAGPVTIKDKAGNTSDPTSVTGIKIDRAPPAVTGAPTTQPNATGWYSGSVVVDFQCTDALSGVAACPTSKLLKGDGADQSVTSDPATDVAGNVSDPVTVNGIDIDGTPPSTTSSTPCATATPACTGSSADVALTAKDQPGLSGVKEIHYSVNGGDDHVVAGATTTVTVPLTGVAGTVTYWAVDNAGNAGNANTLTLKHDTTAPTVTHTVSPAPNADGWNNSDVTVTFAAEDDATASGVTVSPPVTVTDETAGTVVTGRATDTAGNVGTDAVTVKLDKTKPTITGSVTSGTKGSGDWYVGPVKVSFTCSDDLSGIATCPDPVVVTANGVNSVTGTATDKAGNAASVTLSGIRIDQEKPALTTANVNVQGGIYILGAVPTPRCTATDAVSGVASCTVTAHGGNANGVGTFTYVATATDNAGNTTTVTGTYRVVYRCDGFLQPINDTARGTGTSTSIFRWGSTIPAKLQLKRADGTLVKAVAPPVWVMPVRGRSMSAPVDQDDYSDPVDSGATYRYDSSSGQYVYNWRTF